MKEREFIRLLLLFLLCGLISSFLLVPSFSYGGVMFQCCVFGVIYFLVCVFIKNPYIPYFVLNGVGLFLYILNEYIYAARLSYIRIADFYCIGDAMRVSGGYNISFSAGVIVHIVLAVVFTVGGAFGVKILYRFLEKKEFKSSSALLKKKHARWLMPGVFFVICILGTGASILVGDQGYSKFDMDKEYETNGLLLTWVYQYKRSVFTEPEGYSHEKATEILEGYGADERVDDGVSEEEIPQIIVIMNESFTDYSKIGKVSWQKDPLDDIHAIPDLKAGLVVSPVHGGYTANPEFEMLTGMSLNFFPEARVAYLSYLKQPIASLVDDVRDEEYHTYALHPYFSVEFNRFTVYNSILRFDQAVFGENMGSTMDLPQDGVENIEDIHADFGPEHDYVRGFISDKECYDNLLQNLDKGDKEFLFNVTVHNHGGYGLDEYSSDIDTHYTGDPSWDDFLNGLSKSDDGFAYFISELKKRNGKYIVLFFGDHQPALAGVDQMIDIDPAYRVKGGEKELYNYLVPYYIWTNTDVDTSDLPTYISDNYLSLYLKKLAGIPYNNWDRLRERAYELFPVFTTQYVSRDGQSFEPTREIDIRADQVMKDYEMVQYDRLFYAELTEAKK